MAICAARAAPQSELAEKLPGSNSHVNRYPTGKELRGTPGNDGLIVEPGNNVHAHIRDRGTGKCWFRVFDPGKKKGSSLGVMVHGSLTLKCIVGSHLCTMV